MPFFGNISLEISGIDFNSTTNVNKQKTQISNPKSRIPEADVTNTCQLIICYLSIFSGEMLAEILRSRFFYGISIK